MNLKIRVFRNGATQPSNTVTIPGGVLKFASSMVPYKAAAALREQGIDLDEIVRLSESGTAPGTLVEAEDHEKGERVVVSLE